MVAVKFFLVEPEVAGGLGDRTILDNSVHPPRVKKLHYQFDGWLGDSILASFPCFVITEPLMRDLQERGLTGFELDSVEISKSSVFKELYPDRELPEFVWLKPIGTPGKDDISVSGEHGLVVSEKALACLKRHRFDNADVRDYRDYGEA